LEFIRYQNNIFPTEFDSYVRLERNPVYLKDFGQLDTIRWLMNGNDIPVASERIGDLLTFKGLPAFGEATAVYTLNCVTRPEPGYRKRLMGSKTFVLAREGLLLGINGKELSDVDVLWQLPPDWHLVLGRSGRQKFEETQRTLWVAGKTAEVVEEKVDGKTFRIGILEGASAWTTPKLVETVKAIFHLAWDHFGALEDQEFGLAIFPHGDLGGGTALYSSLASEDDPLTIVHEMLHWWTNFLAPAWFREGAHTYIVLKLFGDNGLFDQAKLRAAMEALLQERMRVVKQEGKVYSLADSSSAYDRGAGGGDVYALAPLFAYKLDREIQRQSPKSSIETVFAAVCRSRWRRNTDRPREFPRQIDIVALIKEMTGYDAKPLFDKYFYAVVKDPEVLLK
jgi:hypothetical protein